LFSEESTLPNGAAVGNTVFNKYWWNWNKIQQNNTHSFRVSGGMSKEQTQSWRQLGQKPSTEIVQHRTLDSPIKLHGSQN